MIFLLQRAKIIRPLLPESNMRTALAYDYMGSAEFEFGALPQSLQAMERSQSGLTPVSFSMVRREDGRELLGYGAFNDERRHMYEEALLRVIEAKMRTKEHTSLPEVMSSSTRIPAFLTSAERRQGWLDRLPNFWWDIRNHVMLSFEEDFMEALPGLLQNSWNIMYETK